MEDKIFIMGFEIQKKCKEDEVLGHQLRDRLLFNSIQTVSKWITSGRGSRIKWVLVRFRDWALAKEAC